jgi:CubicO group peptidase (beta-lactamase class C family)
MMDTHELTLPGEYMKLYVRLALFVLLFNFASWVDAAPPVTGLKAARPESVGMSTERLKRLEQAMKRYIDDELVAGTVTLVARKGKVVHFEAQGMADVDSAKPMTTDAIFRIASMTKPITSVALMMLFEEGHFQLHDPIAKWLPEFKDMKVAVPSESVPVGTPFYLVPANKPITVRHVLTHTAGLANNYRGMNIASYHQQMRNIEPGENLETYIKRLATLPLNYQPGERWEYSVATSVVGRLVEVIAGMSLDEFFHARIFTPLQMKDTYFYLPETKVDRLTSQYKPGDDENKIELQDPGSVESRFVKEPHVFFSGSGGLVSTAADYVRFQQMMLNGGELEGTRLLGRKTVEMMFSNHTGDLPIWLRGPGTGFGLGYSVVLDAGAAATTSSVGSVSWGGAYNTVFWIDPEEELIGILMSQVRPYTHLNMRADMISLVNQSIVD